MIGLSGSVDADVDASDQPEPARTEVRTGSDPRDVYLIASSVFAASARTDSGSGAEPAFFAATCWPSVLVTKPRYDFTSSAYLVSLNSVQVMAYETSGMG